MFRPFSVAFALVLWMCLAVRATPAEEASATSGNAPAAGAAGTIVTDNIPSDVESSVVKVFSTLRYPDPFQPWTKQPPTEATASGVVIEGHRILTNAHAVAYASQVQVQASQSADKVSAKVVAMAPGIDLAVLQLDDEALFTTHRPLARASTLPGIKDAVLAYGFPTGGNSLSITKGIVSRIEFVPYTYPVSGLRIQIDAAINPGNSGGPAIAGDKMIGLAFSPRGDAQNNGYNIPKEEDELFHKDIADGHYDGKPALYDDLQTLQNPALRTFLKLDKSAAGIVVTRPARSDASYPLKTWDVITRIGDEPVDDEGMIRLASSLRVSFTYLIQKIADHGSVPLKVIRAGKQIDVKLPVSADRATLVADLKGEYPEYFIYGPLVFSRATTQMLSYFQSNASWLTALGFLGSPLVTQFGESPTPERDQLVVVSSPFFPHPLAKGYGNPAGAVVRSINGTRVKNLRHLVTVLRDLKDDFVVLEFDSRRSETFVFPRKEMLAATEGILSDNGVRAQGSAELMKIWDGAGAAAGK
jgi:S1-C subfamily serine protease